MELLPYLIGIGLAMVIGILLGKFVFSSQNTLNDPTEFKIQLEGKTKELQMRVEQITRLEGDKTRLEAQIRDLGMAQAKLEEQKHVFQEKNEEQKKDIEKMRSEMDGMLKKVQEQMKTDFALIANNLFEEKTDKFKKASQENLSTILSPLKEQIELFKKDVGEKYSTEEKERHTLKSKIDELMLLNKTITEETKNLTTALKSDVKKQGHWGEFKLEKLLESSGLEKGKEYVAQGKGLGLKNEAGNNEQPDFIVFLPDEKHIIIDSKVSLIHYTNYISATSEPERESAIQQLFESVKNHIDDLSGKNYPANEKLKAPDFTFLFFHFEGALSLVIDLQVPRLNMSLMQYAWERKIAVVTPMTLMPSLKTIANLWKFQRQEANAVKIAEAAGKLYDKFHGFVGDMEGVRKKLEDATESHSEAFKKLSTGQGNLIGQVENIKVLGAKAKKALDKKYLVTGEEE